MGISYYIPGLALGPELTALGLRLGLAALGLGLALVGLGLSLATALWLLLLWSLASLILSLAVTLWLGLGFKGTAKSRAPYWTAPQPMDKMHKALLPWT